MVDMGTSMASLDMDMVDKDMAVVVGGNVRLD